MIRFLLFNANGLSGKADAIAQFCTANKVDFAFLVETWLKPGDAPLFGNVIVNMTNNTDTIIQGGRRATGGILGFSPSGKGEHARLLHTSPDGYAVFLDIASRLVVVGYYPPSAADDSLDALFEQIEELSNHFEKEVILLGDFNARMGEAVGDGATNPRGHRLRDCLTDSPLFRNEPTLGKFTTWTHTGHGITDHVISTLALQPRIRQLTVHEHASLGGSDHRPLTFSLEGVRLQRSAAFSRWHIRKFLEEDNRNLYLEYLRNQRHALDCLTNCEQIVLDHTEAGHRLTVDTRQQLVNRAWDAVAGLIEDALEQSIGTFTYKPRMNADFWTPELVAMREAIENLEPTNPAHTEMNRTYREMLREQRYTIFHDECEKLGDPQFDSSFLKMVKCRGRRTNRSETGLDKGQLDEYVQHFRTTFAGPPTGHETEKDRPLLEATNPSDLEAPQQGYQFTNDDVTEMIKFLAMGKAAGIDGIAAEALRYGAAELAHILARLFALISRLVIIPTEWAKALIHPVFKKKGRAVDIVNYRPIALTVVCRRLYERLIMVKLEGAVQLLADPQGGFRRHRATHQQVFFLDQIMKENPDCINAFLDLKAAYDVVDREILWTCMSREFQVPDELIRILRSLFDFNSSCLVVNGSRSAFVENLRGLLQGSSLSPILFNFYINSLLVALRTQPTLQVAGLRTNA